MLALSRLDSPLTHASPFAPTPRPVTVACDVLCFAAIDEKQRVLMGSSNRKPGASPHVITLPEPAQSVHCMSTSCIIIGESGRIFHTVMDERDRPGAPVTVPLPEPAVSIMSWDAFPVVVGGHGRLYESGYPYRATLSFEVVPTTFRVRRADYFGTALVVLATDGTLYSDHNRHHPIVSFVRVPLPEPGCDIVRGDQDDMVTRHIRLVDHDDGCPRYVRLVRDSEGSPVVDSTVVRRPFTPGVLHGRSSASLPVPGIVGQCVIEGAVARDFGPARSVVVRTDSGYIYYARYSRSKREYVDQMTVTTLERLRAQ